MRHSAFAKADLGRPATHYPKSLQTVPYMIDGNVGLASCRYDDCAENLADASGINRVISV